jgi:hypothetical protein
MYTESADDNFVTVYLVCDRPDCTNSIMVFTPTHEECQHALLATGWSLYRGKQLCPAHTRAVRRRLRR